MELWRRIAQDHLAAANLEVGKAVAQIIQEQLRKFEGDLDLNFNYDAKAGGLLKGSDTGLSFPARPHSFDEPGGLNGTFLVTMTFNPPVTGSGSDIAGMATTISMDVEFFFKTPTEPGGGKRMWKTPAGRLECVFGTDGEPDIEDTGDVAILVDVISALEEKAFAETPKGAKSLTRDPQHRKEQRELNEIGRKHREEQEREKAQGLKQQEQKEADKVHYGSVEAFVDYIVQQDLEEFSLADLQKVLQTMFPDNASRMVAQAEIKKQIEDYGLRFNPGLKKLSSRLDLACIAARLASDPEPSVLTFEMPGDQDWDMGLWDRIGVGPDWERLEQDFQAAGATVDDTEDITIEFDPANEAAVRQVMEDARAGKYGADVQAYWSQAQEV